MVLLGLQNRILDTLEIYKTQLEQFGINDPFLEEEQILPKKRVKMLRRYSNIEELPKFLRQNLAAAANTLLADMKEEGRMIVSRSDVINGIPFYRKDTQFRKNTQYIS